MTRARVLAIDDHTPVRGWIKTICEQSETLEMIGAYGSTDAVPIPERTEPDVIVLDLLLDASGLWTGLTEVETWGRPIVVLSSSTGGAVVNRAFQSGASAFVGKAATERQMTTALEMVADGASGLVFAAEKPTKLPPGLTPALLALLEEITKTTDTAELAKRLSYDKHTIEVYVGRLYDALDTRPRNRAALVAQAEALGF